jgi:hypothetical protein
VRDRARRKPEEENMKTLACSLSLLTVALGLCATPAGARAPRRNHHIDATIRAAVVLNVANWYTDAGVINGTLGDGAFLETDSISGSSFSGSGTSFYPNGSLWSTSSGQITHHAGGATSELGRGTFNGGTGTYTWATGSFTFTATIAPHATVGIVHVIGNANY